MVEPKDLTGDPVYDRLKKDVKPECTLIGGNIVEKTHFGPKEPRKVIDLIIEHKETKVRKVYSYNYNKIKKDLQDRGDILCL